MITDAQGEACVLLMGWGGPLAGFFSFVLNLLSVELIKAPLFT